MYRKGLPFELTALSCANDCIGLEEEPGNRGAAIKIIQRAANIPVGSPWCAAFVNWCAEYASVVHNKESPLENVPLQGYVQSYYEWGVHNNLIVPEGFLGAIFLRWGVSSQRYDHMGFVDIGVRGNVFYTIEGNTNKSGSREGVAVLRRERNITRGQYKFIDWTKGM